MALPGMEPSHHHPPSHDWAGAVPAKFSDKFTGKSLSRRICATETRNGQDANLARQGLVGYFTDTRGLVTTEGKRVVPQNPSDVYNWRQGKRSLSEPGAFHMEKPEGLKKVESHAPKICSIREKRHIRQAASKEEHGDRPVGPTTVVRDNGYRAADQIAQEIDVTNEMQRKVRPNDLYTQRNGILCKALGDKNYRHPDYCPRFHHAGGLIVGAGFHRGNYAKTEARNATGVKIENVERGPVKSYAEKQREKELMEANAEVENLTKSLAMSEEQVISSWEAYALKECDTANYDDYDTDDETGLEGDPVFPHQYKVWKSEQAPPEPVADAKGKKK